jgi:DHA1 family multidrug resistance protein-like MFS transporter
MAMAGFGITVPVMPFLARQFGASPLEVSLLVSLFALTQFLSGPVWGALSDRFGRKKILVAGLLGYSLSFFLAGLSHSVAALVASRALGGLLSASIFPASQALVADLTQARDRGPAMAALGAWVNLGFLCGPVVGGLLSPLGYGPPLFVAGAIVLVTAILAVYGLREKPTASSPDGPAVVEGTRRGRPSLQDLRTAARSDIAPYLFLTLAMSFSVSSLTALLGYYVIDRFGGTSANAGVVFSAQGLVAFLVQSLLVGRLMRKFGERRLALVGAAICAVGFLAVVPARTFPMAVAAAMIVGLGSSALRPSLTSTVSLMTPLPQGLTLGVQSSLDAMGRVLGPTVGGWLYGFGLTLPFWCAAITQAAAGVVVALKTARPKTRLS